VDAASDRNKYNDREVPRMTLGITVAHYHAGLEVAAATVAIAILLSSLDDLLIDAWYWCRRLVRWWTLERTGRLKPLTPEQLRAREEQPIAIMVPAWKESDVIAAMVENMVQVLDYRQYTVFVGTYCNDQETIDEVDRMARRYRQVRRVEVPHPGPTCKADCLNFVGETIFAHEQEHGMEFAGVVLHDSEDVLHPLELKFFNYLLPRKDMIQLPVASLERGLNEWVAGTYMDEFAESHGKEMVVRESVADTVPSAGVGTCFSRRALMGLVGATRNHPFNISSLTEDYDVGMRLQALGMQSIFGRFPVTYKVHRKTWRGKEVEVELTAPLSVREFFPDNFHAAYRQKSRWALGIGLQGWHQIPWRGRSARARYFLLHDRKGIVTCFIGIVAYVVLLQFVALHIGAAAGWWPASAPELFAAGSPWIALVWANAGFFAFRAWSRLHFTTQLYGWRHGLMSVPRMVIGNFVNCMAVGRAWRMYLASVFLGKKLVWDKTAHEFPTGHQLARAHKKLGELLQTWQAVDAEQLSQALAHQGGSQTPLGQVLIAKGWLDEETLAEAIAYQADLPRAPLTLELVQQHAGGAWPAALALRHRAVHVGSGKSGQPVLAVARALPAEALAEAAQLLGAAPLQRVARDSEITAALDVACGEAGLAIQVRQPALGALVADAGQVDRGHFESALGDYRPDQHGLLGEFLVERGVIVKEAIDEALRQQRAVLDPGAATPA
jgi:adsorption protein B